MLRLKEKVATSSGYFRTGRYSLVIASRNRRTGDIDLIQGAGPIEGIVKEYVFRPNPTDIDDNTQFANVVRPDQEGGFYIDVNEVGAKILAIRGTTGQFPIVNPVNQVAGVTTTALSSQLAPLTDLLPGQGGDGHSIWVELYNFFVLWSNLISERPHAYAMVFVNTKDGEIYEVSPIALRKTRTSARPLSYGYSIEMNVVGEVTGSSLLALSWAEQISNIRSQIKKWSGVINRSLLLMSQIAQNVASSAIGSVFGPVNETLTGMANGVQSFQQMGSTLQSYGASSVQQVQQVAERLANGQAAVSNPTAGTTYSDTTHRATPSGMIPPTAQNIRGVYEEATETIALAMVGAMTAGEFGTGEISTLGLEDPTIDNYGLALDLMFQGFLASDLAPMPGSSPTGTAATESSDMHRVARAGAAGIIKGRSDEFASAKLAGDTMMVEDDTYSLETRHGNDRTANLAEYSLSYLAALVAPEFVTAHNEKMSPQLSAFRRWFLSMEDPSTFAPYYKPIKVGITDTIYSLASRHLGSWDSWPMIALINDLKYPYISKNGGQYQAAPGDLIYIPINNAPIPVEVLETFLNITKTHDLLQTIDIFLGFDIEINQLTGDAVYSVYDFGHIAGQQAFAQELAIVLEGSGGLTPERHFGPPIRIGTKSQGGTMLALWHSVIKQWLLNDHRVQEVEWVHITQDGPSLYWEARINFVGFDTALTTAGSMRN